MTDYFAQIGEILTALNRFAQNAVPLFTAIAALASFIAASAGLWAANSAYQATRNVQKLARLGLLRNLIQAAYDVIAEADQASLILEEFKVQIQTLATFSGHGRGPMVDKITREAEAKYEKAVPLKEEAHGTVSGFDSLLKRWSTLQASPFLKNPPP